jgi:hypothetical protein
MPYARSLTVFGIQVYAVGGNEKAARVSDIHTQNVMIMPFMLMGILAGVAGILSPAFLPSAQAVIEPGQKQFGKSQNLLWVDVTSKKGRDQYQECLNLYQGPDDRITVPIVALGGRVLIGDEI